MYGGQPLPHAHPLQHAQQPFDVSGDLSVDPNAQPVMDSSDFAAYPFSFDAIHDPAAVIPLQTQQPPLPSAPFPPDSLASSRPPAPSQPPADSLSDTSISKATFDGAAPQRKPSLATSPDDGSHGSQRDRLSSLTADDDFELSGSARGRADGTDLGGRSNKDGSGKTDAPPPWSELKTKAGKDRKRLPLACIACRRKKIRCSGEKPACKHCLRSRIPCVYKVTTRKAAPRTDYMAMLDKRLKRMEERIIKVIPKSDQGPTSSVTRAVVKPAIPGTLAPSKPGAGPKKRGADEAFGVGLEAWAKASPKIGPAGLGDEDASSTAPEAQESDETQLFLEGRDALPSKDIQEHLAEVYFDNLYGQAYPLLHKPSYMRKLKNNTLPPVLVLSVCAVSARFSASPKLSSPTRQFLRGEEWAAPARDICTRRYESPNITILTCLLILGLHEFGTCQGGRSWALGGQATRMAFALQLHKDLEYDPTDRGDHQKPLSFVDREIRRRIMWSCFLMDRFNSSGTERPIFIMEESVNIPLPVKERHFQLDMPAVTETLNGSVPQGDPVDADAAGDARDNMGVAAFMIRAVALWGRIIAYVNQGGRDTDENPMWSDSSDFSRICNEADNFELRLPEAVHYTSDNITLHQNHHTTNLFMLMHIIIQQNILFLHRTALSPSDGKPADFIARSRSAAFGAADRISQMLRDAEERRVTVTAPVAGYCAFSSTTMHIRGIVSGDPAVKAPAEANATTNIRFLRRMMKFWGMFHWMEEDIRLQYRHALDRSRSGLPPDDATTTSPVLQYGDWFNRYPNGVSEHDFMDPAIHKRRDKGADGVLEQKPELHSVEEFFTMLSSPKAAEPAPSSAPPTAPKRKATAKRNDKTPAAKVGQPSKQKPPTLDMAGTTPSSSLGPDVHATPGAPQPQPQPQPQHQQQHHHPQQQTPHPQQQQRRPSAPLVGQAGAASPFHHPLTTSHPQAAAYHSMSPMSPADQFQPNPQAQAGFYNPAMMHMSMPQQPAPMMQPIDQHLSFGGGFSMEPGNVHAGQQHMMRGVQGWHGAPGGGQQMQGQNVGGGMGLDPQQQQQQQQQPHGHVQGQPAPDGMNPGGWYVPPDMQPSEAFNGTFGGGGMPAQNPLGGLRHAH